MRRELYTIITRDNEPEKLEVGGELVFDKYLPFINESSVIPDETKKKIWEWFTLK